MNGITLVKGIISIGTGWGVGTIVGVTFRVLTPVGSNILTKGAIMLGAMGLGGYLGVKSANYMEELFDDGLEVVENVKKEYFKKEKNAKAKA